MTRLLQPLPLTFGSSVLTQLRKKYFAWLPLLIAAVLCAAGVTALLMSVEPAQLRDLLLPNSYAPLVLLWAVGQFFFWSFVFLNTRRGSLVALFFTAVLFLQLQALLTAHISLQIGAVCLVIEISSESFLLLWRRYSSQISRSRFQFTPAQEIYPTTAVSEKKEVLPSSRHRRHGRQRQHHFFGK